MTTRRVICAVALLALLVSGSAPGLAQDPPTAAEQSSEATPARVSYIYGDVSFWRPGADDWAEARVNTPLAPGDMLYTGPGGNVEIQFGPKAFVRAGNGTQIGLDNQEPDYVQFRVAAGHAALDLRELPAGNTVELATPNGAFTVERPGYYHVDLNDTSATFRTHRGGTATLTPPGGAATPIGANQQVVVTGTDAPRVEVTAAPALSAWDNWNYQRTAYLIHPSNTQNVSAAVYGSEALAQHGNWRTVDTYGSVWVPATVAPGWVPYSTGRWIWDPRFGWTWLDDAPWGWAPYHYGRWVFVGSYWAWAPGPVIVRPVYSPALVVFLGGPVAVAVRPLHWAPLGWGEPIIPWWGRPGFVGVATWHGWGGPRVVNNVVVNRTTVVNVTNITVYKNVHVHNAVVGVPADRFGHGAMRPTRVEDARVRELTPVRGALEVKPVAASVMPAGGSAVKPPAVINERKVVATRAPRDVRPALQAEGLTGGRDVTPIAPPRIVPAPKREREAPATAAVPDRPGAGDKSRRPEDKARGPEDRRGPEDKKGGGAAGGAVEKPRVPDDKARRADDKPRSPEDKRGPEDKKGATEDKARLPDDRARPTEDKKPRAAVPPEPKPGQRPGQNGERARAPQHPAQQPPPPPAHDPTVTRQAPPARPQAAPEGPGQRGRSEAKPDPRAKGQGERGGEPGPGSGPGR
jgi:hypothetical protein